MGVKRMQRAKLAAAYLLLALAAALGWLYSCLPDRSIWSRDKPYIFPALHGRAAARPWKPECRQHPGGGQLPDDADAGWVAPHQDHPGSGDRAAQSDRLRYTVRRQDVLRRGAHRGIFGDRAGWRRDIESRQGGRASLGDRVICIGQTRTESNDAVKEALDAARGSPWRSCISAAASRS